MNKLLKEIDKNISKCGNMLESNNNKIKETTNKVNKLLAELRK